MLFEFLQLLVREIFKIDKLISCAFESADHLIKFKVHCFGVTILCILNQKYHQECDNRCSGVDDQLPSVGKMKSGACEDPDTNDKHSSSKCPGAAEHHGGTPRENTECVADNTKEIAFLFALF